MKRGAKIAVGCGVALVAALYLLCRDARPPDVRDLVLERRVVPEDQNACAYFLTAAATFNWPTNARQEVEGFLAGESIGETFMRALVARNAAAIATLQRGLDAPDCQLPEVPHLDAPKPYVASWRNMGRLLAAKAALERRAAKFETAAADIGVLLRFADRLGQNSECLSDTFCAMAMLGVGLEEAGRLARSVAVPAEVLARLAASVRDVRPLDGGLVRGFKNAYQGQADALDRLPTENATLEVPWLAVHCGYFYQPNRTKTVAAQCCRQAIRNAALTYDRMVLSPSPGLALELDLHPNGRAIPPNTIGRDMLALLLPAYDRVLERKCRVETSLDATRLIVACRRYERQQGTLPETLQALVPAWIEAVPRDPFDGQPFRYSRTRAIVYSVGRDLKDSGGATNAVPDRQDPSPMWNAQDAVFDIEGAAAASR